MKTQPSAHLPSQKQILGTGAYKYAKTATTFLSLL